MELPVLCLGLGCLKVGSCQRIVSRFKRFFDASLRAEELLERKEISLFQVNDRFTRKPAIRVAKLQNQASISRHIPNGRAAVSFQFVKLWARSLNNADITMELQA
jgi:hypothetical protein